VCSPKVRLREIGLLFADGTLAITLKVKKITKIFRKIPNRGDGDLDAENEWHSGWVIGICRTVSRHRSSSRSNASLSKTAKSIDTTELPPAKTASARVGNRNAYSNRPATTPTAPTGILPRIHKSVGAASQPAEGAHSERDCLADAKALGLRRSARHISVCACFWDVVRKLSVCRGK